MLTDIPPALLHRVRDGAAYVHDLAQLGLALLCPCEDDHGAGARWLLGSEDKEPAAEPPTAEALAAVRELTRRLEAAQGGGLTYGYAVARLRSVVDAGRLT